MKLGFSKKGDPRGRHLVLLVSSSENHNGINNVIIKEVLQGKIPVFDRDIDRSRYLYRFSLTYLNRIRTVFPFVELSPALDRYIVAQERKDLEKVEVPDITVPGLYDYRDEKPADLHPFQKVTVEMVEQEIEETIRLAQEGATTELPSFDVNHGMGLGKTLIAVGVAVRKQWFPALMVVPNSGKWSTKRIIDRYFDDDFTYQIVDGVRAQREAQILSGADLTIINVEGIRMKRQYNRSTREWEETATHPALFWNEDGSRKVWNLLIADEHHRCRNPDAQQTQGFLQLKTEKFLPMSGTPIFGRIEHLWPVLHKMNPDKYPTSYQFMKDACLFNSNGNIIGYYPQAVQDIRKYLHAKSYRLRREHVSDQLPKIVYVQRDVILTPEQRRLYKQIEEELIVELEDGTEQKVFNALTRFTRLKQACFSPELYGGSKNSAKITAMREDIEELVSSGEKAIVFSQWSKATRILQREFEKYNPAYVDGTVKGSKRSAQEDKFNEDDSCHLYIGTIGANQEAITLSAATYVLFADLDWIPMVNQQAADRSAAGGLRGAHLTKEDKVHIIEYYAVDTIEDYIQELLRRKQATFDMIVERDGGVKLPKITMRDIRSLLRPDRAA